MRRLLVLVMIGTTACVTDHASDDAAMLVDIGAAQMPDVGSAMNDASFANDVATFDAAIVPSDASFAPDVFPPFDAGPTPDTGPHDAGSDAGVDAGPPPPVTVASGSTLSEGCLGAATAPTGGAMTSGDLTVTEYLSMAPIANTAVDLYVPPVVTVPCMIGSGCESGVTLTAGQALFAEPVGGWFAMHLHASNNTAETISYQLTWSAGSTAASGFASSTLQTIAALLGRTFQSSTDGIIVTDIHDCAGNALANAEMRVFVGATRVFTGPAADRTSPRITGLSGTNPTRNGLTGSGGTGVAVNIPAGTACHVEMWGVLASGMPEQLIGCEEGVVVAGGITTSSIGPLRGDYAPGSVCATVPRM